MLPVLMANILGALALSARETAEPVQRESLAASSRREGWVPLQSSGTYRVAPGFGLNLPKASGSRGEREEESRIMVTLLWCHLLPGQCPRSGTVLNVPEPHLPISEGDCAL